MAFRIISSKEEVDDGEVEVVLDKNMVFPWKTRSVAELAGGEPWRWQAPGLKPPLEPATVPPKGGRVGEKRVITGSSMKPKFPQKF